MRTRRVVVLSALSVLAACSLKMPSGGGQSGSGPSGGGAQGGASGAPASSSGMNGSSVSTGAFPLVTPPVKAAAPKGFGGAMGGSHASPSHPGHFFTLDTNDIRSRFFSMGPTNVYGLLGAIDDRIQGYNMRVQNGAPACMQAAPVAYTIHPFGADVTFYAQCVDKIGSSDPADPGFVQFGTKDGVVYYYSAVGAGWTAAILTPSTAAGDAGAGDAGVGDASTDDASAGGASGEAGAAPTTYRVHAWSGVGYLNADGCGNKGAFDDCSYGVIELVADASTATFEMAVAGIGFGYCGAQLKSNGAIVYGIGSPDMGQTCNAPGTFCVQASDVTTPAMCDGDAVQMLSLTPLGRRASMGSGLAHVGGGGDGGAAWGASQYPGADADQVVLDGTASDSLRFGPTQPTTGVALF